MNLFSITCLIIFVSSIGFGASLYSGDRSMVVNRKWFIFSIAIGLWSLGLFGVTWSDSRETALRWQYLLDVSAIFIPALYFSFASTLAKRKNIQIQRILFIVAILLSAFSFSSLFKQGMVFKYNSFFWIEPGAIYIVFPIFFLSIILACLYIYIFAYKCE